MIKKVLVIFISIVGGYLTILSLPGLDGRTFLSIFSELILNPFRYFLGMVAFIATAFALSSFMKSTIEQTFSLFRKKQKLNASIIIDYSSFCCYLFFIKKSVLITVLLLIFSTIIGISAIENKKDDLKERGY